MSLEVPQTNQAQMIHPVIHLARSPPHATKSGAKQAQKIQPGRTQMCPGRVAATSATLGAQPQAHPDPPGIAHRSLQHLLENPHGIACQTL